MIPLQIKKHFFNKNLKSEYTHFKTFVSQTLNPDASFYHKLIPYFGEKHGRFIGGSSFARAETNVECRVLRDTLQHLLNAFSFPAIKTHTLIQSRAKQLLRLHSYEDCISFAVIGKAFGFYQIRILLYFSIQLSAKLTFQIKKFLFCLLNLVKRFTLNVRRAIALFSRLMLVPVLNLVSLLFPYFQFFFG